MKEYRGIKDESGGGKSVFIVEDGDRRKLSPNPSLKLVNHSPTGFQWGYGGSGPAQLALAILLDVTGDPERSQRFYQNFKREFVANWEGSFKITEQEVIHWLQEKEVSPMPANNT